MLNQQAHKRGKVSAGVAGPQVQCQLAKRSKMPKRKNPFGDAAPIQLKTHVGFKQAATEKEKQEVYGECACKEKQANSI